MLSDTGNLMARITSIVFSDIHPHFITNTRRAPIIGAIEIAKSDARYGERVHSGHW